jgi:hypothetical protein
VTHPAIPELLVSEREKRLHADLAMTAEAVLKFALRRALWAQDFAAPLLELGAPASQADRRLASR